MIHFSDIKVGDFIYKINIDGLFSVGFQLVRANREPNNPEVVGFGSEEQGKKVCCVIDR